MTLRPKIILICLDFFTSNNSFLLRETVDHERWVSIHFVFIGILPSTDLTFSVMLPILWREQYPTSFA